MDSSLSRCSKHEVRTGIPDGTDDNVGAIGVVGELGDEGERGIPDHFLSDALDSDLARYLAMEDVVLTVPVVLPD